jgi:hypothetical protein
MMSVPRTPSPATALLAVTLGTVFLMGTAWLIVEASFALGGLVRLWEAR